MAKSRFTGEPVPWPRWPFQLFPNTGGLSDISFNSNLLDALNEKIYVIGYVTWEDGLTHSIQDVLWRSGTSTLVGTVQLSLRDVDLANTTAPGRDDGVADQSVDIVNPAANTNFASTLSAVRSTPEGTLLAVVWQCTNWVSGSFTVKEWGIGAVDRFQLFPFARHATPAPVFTGESAIPQLIFVASDGTIGKLRYGPLRMSQNNVIRSLTSTSNPRRVGLQYTPNKKLWVNSIALWHEVPDLTANFKVSIYEGDTEIASVTVDASAYRNTLDGKWTEFPIPETALLAGTQYRFVAEGLAASALRILEIDVTDASHFNAFADGLSYVSHDGAATWTEITTRFPIMYIGISAVDDGSGVEPVGITNRLAYTASTRLIAGKTYRAMLLTGNSTNWQTPATLRGMNVVADLVADEAAHASYARPLVTLSAQEDDANARGEIHGVATFPALTLTTPVLGVVFYEVVTNDSDHIIASVHDIAAQNLTPDGRDFEATNVEGIIHVKTGA